MFYVSPELYRKHKDFVVSHGLGRRQRYEDGKYVREMTDKEIAEVLGISEKEVTEIRAVAEIDTLPPNSWEEAEEWKTLRSREILMKRGIVKR